MIPPAMQNFLSRLRNHLTVREERANSIASEIHSHLCADVEGRVSSGQAVGDAVRDSLLELGDPADIAHQFNSLQEVDRRRMTMARNVAAVMLATVGFFGAIFCCDFSGLMKAVGHLLPRNPNGVLLVSGWLGDVYKRQASDVYKRQDSPLHTGAQVGVHLIGDRVRPLLAHGEVVAKP